jgi:hypothetical protein
MHAPPEFQKMAANFHQDVLLPPDTLADAAKFALWNLSSGERETLKAFLSQIVTQYSDEQLEMLWAQTRAEIGFPEGLRMVLTMVRDQVTSHNLLPGEPPALDG